MPISAASAAKHAAGLQRIYSTMYTATAAASAAGLAVSPEGWVEFAQQVRRTEYAAQADLLRDSLGPTPRHTPEPLPESVLAWNEGCVVKLATSIYTERDFAADRLAVLSDALEDAGCADAALRNHLRGAAGHARGCWLVDLILGRG